MNPFSRQTRTTPAAARARAAILRQTAEKMRAKRTDGTYSTWAYRTKQAMRLEIEAFELDRIGYPRQPEDFDSLPF